MAKRVRAARSRRPVKRRKVSRRSKRSFRRKPRGKLNPRARTSRLKLMNGFPSKAMVRFPYYDNFSTGSLNTASDSVSDIHTIHLNSLFDPNGSGVGTQPKWFDEIAAIYENYNVYKVVVEVRVWAESGGTANDSDMGIIFLDPYDAGFGTDAATATDVMLDRRYTKKHIRWADSGDHTKGVRFFKTYFPNKMKERPDPAVHYTPMSQNPGDAIDLKIRFANNTNAALAAGIILRGYYRLWMYAHVRDLIPNVLS